MTTRSPSGLPRSTFDETRLEVADAAGRERVVRIGIGRRSTLACLGLLAVAPLVACRANENVAQSMASLEEPLPKHAQFASFPNAAGVEETLHLGGIETESPFFESLGTNGRKCGDCHALAAGWSVTPSQVAKAFAESAGLAPLFASVDGANAAHLDRDTVDQRRAASSLLLQRGVFAVRVPIPTGAELDLASADDPYRNPLEAGPTVFRRPLPTMNLGSVVSVMWDGRVEGGTLDARLKRQADDATTGHAESARHLTNLEKEFIVRFEKNNIAAQKTDSVAGPLTDGARGGATNLWRQKFYPGINAIEGDSQTGRPFDPKVFDLYDGWKDADATESTDRTRARARIHRGQELFNRRSFQISKVAGVTDNPRFDAFRAPGDPSGALTVTCSVCHNAPNVGTHSTELFVNTGVSDAARRAPEVPLYTFRRIATGETVQTTDAGRAMVTGRWADIGKVKIPVLRALASRPPHFHDGSAKAIEDVVDFYDQRFRIDLTAAEKGDLAAFLRAL